MLNRAYEVLRDPKLKKAYDLFGSKGIGTSASSDIENLKREQARRRSTQHPRPSNPSTASTGSTGTTDSYYSSGNAGFGSDWPSGTTGFSPFANRDGSRGRSVSVDSAGVGGPGRAYAGRSGASSPGQPRGRVTDPNPVGTTRRSATAGPASNGPNFDTFRVDKSPFESTARPSSTRPGSSSQRVKSTGTTTSGPEFQSGPKGDNTAYYGDMGSVHAQPGTGYGYSDDRLFVPQDGVPVTAGEAFFGRGPKFGRDVLMDVEIDVKTAKAGGKKWIEVRHMEKCTACDGAGTKDPSRTKVSNCQHCGGTGHTMNAAQKRETCSACLGTGRAVSNPCDTCKGSGLEETIKSREVVIPKQVEDGFTMRIPGQGDAGPNGGPAGDLYVCFSIPGMKKKKTVRTPDKNAPKKRVILSDQAAKIAGTLTGAARQASLRNAQTVRVPGPTAAAQKMGFRATTPPPAANQRMGYRAATPPPAAAANQRVGSRATTPPPPANQRVGSRVATPPPPANQRVGFKATTPPPGSTDGSSQRKRTGLRGFFGGVVSRVRGR
jgi:DnaJ-class molecular chaperone